MTYTVSCPSCDTSFPVDPAKVPEGGVRAQCSVCPEIFDVSRPDEATPETPEGLDSTADSALAAEPFAAPTEPIAEAAGSFETAAEPFADTTEPFAETAESFEATLEPLADTTEAFQEAAGPFEATGDPTSVDHSFLESDFVAEDEPTAPEIASPEDSDFGVGSESIASGPLETSGFVEAEAPPIPEAPPIEEPTESIAPIRFGRRSPEDKARSLARSLVSDLIAYNPEKHKDALEAGTLAEVFGEEIEKSLKEYEEQVEADVVDRGSIFNDALNSILAEGRSVFSLGQ